MLRSIIKVLDVIEVGWQTKRLKELFLNKRGYKLNRDIESNLPLIYLLCYH